jgi:hypothetical protein
LAQSVLTRSIDPEADVQQINHSTGEDMIRNRLVVGGLVAGLLGGGVAGAVFGVPGLVAAQDGTTTTSEATTTQAPTTEAPSTTVKDGVTTTTVSPAPNGTSGNTDIGGKGKQSREQHLKDVLAPLVANGTITQAQADAVIKAIQDAAPAMGGKGPGPGPRFGLGFGFGELRQGLDTITNTIGVSKQDLFKALASGQSIADVAKAHNVDPQKVIDALNAQAKAALDKAVAAGVMTQDQANQALLKAGKAIQDLVNGNLPGGLPFEFGHGGPDFGLGGPGQGNPGSTTQGD